MFTRNAIKGFVGTAIVGSGFLFGFNADLLRSVTQNDPRATAWRAQTTPALLARVLQPTSAKAQGPDLPPTETYYNVMNTIRSDYYTPATASTKVASSTKTSDLPVSSVTRLTYAGIDGMLGSIGDPYTVFWTPDEYKEETATTSGNFMGIGAKLDLTKDRKVLIVEPIENSPAIKAGILPGDIITAVDGKSVFGQDLQKVISQIKGPEGTKVTLTIERKGKPLTFKLTRAVVHSPIVEYRMEDEARKIGYIQLGMFTEQADVQFDAALSRLEKKGMKALIFDLRNNPGGLLNVAQALASRFIDHGPIVWVKEKSGRMTSLDVEGDHHRSPLYKGAYPVVVLVNGGSASASEIVSGAIQDAGVGTLLGTKTYGKGLVQTIIPLQDSSAVKITTQHYYTRNKNDINTKRDEDGKALSGTGGIKPNIVVELTEKDLDAQREALRKNPQDKLGFDKLDPQVRKAVEILTAKMAKKTAQN